MDIEILGVDPRCLVTEKLKAPHPLPFVSRRALKRVKERVAIPTYCNCCGGPVRLVNNMEIYNGTEYGEWPYAYLCDHCEAYVGIHPKTDLPLGTLADPATREARKQKKLFIPLIQTRFNGNRYAAYLWLANGMGIEKHLCHWGIFTTEQCNQAAAFVKKETGEKQCQKPSNKKALNWSRCRRRKPRWRYLQTPRSSTPCLIRCAKS